MCLFTRKVMSRIFMLNMKKVSLNFIIPKVNLVINLWLADRESLLSIFLDVFQMDTSNV